MHRNEFILSERASEACECHPKTKASSNKRILMWFASNEVTHTRIHKITTKKSANHGTNLIRIDGWILLQQSFTRKGKKRRKNHCNEYSGRRRSTQRNEKVLSSRSVSLVAVMFNYTHKTLSLRFRWWFPPSAPLHHLPFQFISSAFVIFLIPTHTHTSPYFYFCVFFLHYPSAILLQSILHAVWRRIFVLAHWFSCYMHS